MEQERRKYDDLLATTFANAVNKSQNVEGVNAMTDDDADEIISALRNAGILVEFSQGGLDTAKKQQQVQA